MSGRRDERGAITPAIVILLSGMFGVAGLVYDGGTALSARTKALGEAEAAARAGAQALTEGALRGDAVVLDSDAARDAAGDYLRAAGRSGVVNVAGDTVETRVSFTQPTRFLGMVGVRSFQVSVTGSSEAVRGVSQEEGP